MFSVLVYFIAWLLVASAKCTLVYFILSSDVYQKQIKAISITSEMI